MLKRHQRKTTTTPMSCNNHERELERERESTSLLPSITYFFLASNCIGATYRAYAGGNYSFAAFIIFIYSAFLLLEYFLSAYQKLPPHQKSRKKDLLKFAIWFLFTAIMFGFSYQFAPFFCLAAGLSLYAISTAGSAFLFYVYVVYDHESGSAMSCSDEKRKFSHCSCGPDHEKMINNKKIKRSDSSVLEKV